MILYLLISYWLSSYSTVLNFFVTNNLQGIVWLDVHGCLYLMNLCTEYDLFRAKTALKDRQSGVTGVPGLESGQTILNMYLLTLSNTYGVSLAL